MMPSRSSPRGTPLPPPTPTSIHPASSSYVSLTVRPHHHPCRPHRTVIGHRYLHSKFVQLEEGQPITNKRVRRAWAEHREGWARAYFVLLNNGKLKYYESAGAAAMPANKRVELGEINLRLFAVMEVSPSRLLPSTPSP